MDLRPSYLKFHMELDYSLVGAPARKKSLAQEVAQKGQLACAELSLLVLRKGSFAPRFGFPPCTTYRLTSCGKVWRVMNAFAVRLASLLCCCTSCAWAASVQWPSDSVIRRWALEKRGLGLFGPEKAQQVPKLKVSPWLSGSRSGCASTLQRLWPCAARLA